MVRHFSRVPCSFGLVFSVHPQLANFFSAENHYTADYPEDEVDSDDEFDRHPYMFRNENASDEEEFDNRFFDENDDDEMVLEGDDDDATMARIRTFMRRKAAFR